MGKKSHPNTIWIDIKKQIEYSIIDGTYKSACKMPSISQVAESYSCGKSTAQKVLEELYDEGIITKQKGVGYFVKPFVREKLEEKYMDEWKSQLSHNIREAYLLGVKQSDLEENIKKQINDIYSP